MSFDEFLELDEQLQNDPESLALEDRQLIESVELPCSFSAADLPG